MTNRSGKPAKVVFVWENLGPSHIDRLEALNDRFPDQVFAVQLSASSHTYKWDGTSGQAVPTTTLFDQPEDATGLACMTALVGAVRKLGATDVYLCHYQLWPMLMSAMILRLLGKRVVVMIDSKFDDYPRRLWHEVGKSAFLWPYNAALTASLRSRDYLRFLGFRKRQIELGYDTLSVARIRGQSASLPAPGGALHSDRDFLIIARLEEKKNIGSALEAYSLWQARGGTGRVLRILGSGALEDELRDKSVALGIGDAVIFEGFVQTERVSEALSNALCLILPSTEEQFGLVVIEAMAMGVPALVSSNAGAVDVMIDNGVNGWVINPRSPAALAAAMTSLSDDESCWKTMASAAQTDSLRGDANHFVTAVAKLSGLGQAPSDE
ncbi:glycosyltransferase [Altererythrobacter sp. ZODW24]|uniref:glycosyltransferase family 4 protein n=1 Tax=Altererythrobacter sp. ZODW24 TaxID=2185142 RepID=UPI000DF759AB|nr:glycosyltransferase [Altererythrobacter sp. ZODW24]